MQHSGGEVSGVGCWAPGRVSIAGGGVEGVKGMTQLTVSSEC